MRTAIFRARIRRKPWYGVRAELVCGKRYRATVVMAPALRTVVTPAMVETELRRYQLFGQVTDIGTGYRIEADFRGKTGSYDLPAEVQTIEIVR